MVCALTKGNPVGRKEASVSERDALPLWTRRWKVMAVRTLVLEAISKSVSGEKAALGWDGPPPAATVTITGGAAPWVTATATATPHLPAKRAAPQLPVRAQASARAVARVSSPPGVPAVASSPTAAAPSSSADARPSSVSARPQQCEMAVGGQLWLAYLCMYYMFVWSQKLNGINGSWRYLVA